MALVKATPQLLVETGPGGGLGYESEGRRIRVSDSNNLAAELAAIGWSQQEDQTILHAADIASRPPRLWPQDSTPFELFCSDGQYAYGHDATQNILRRVNVASMAQDNGYDFGAGTSIVDMYSGHSILLAVVLVTATDKYSLWRSADQGVTFTSVHNIGTSPDGLSHGATIKILMRGLDFGEIGGRQAIVFGTYNVSSATAGTDGDTVYVAASYDNGVTWQKLNTWNIGTRKIKHFHVVKYDTYRKNWLFGTGDAGSEMATFRWDGISTWPGDVIPASFGAGFTVLAGESRHRVVDIQITQDWLYSFTDTISAPEGGIWRMLPDLTNKHRVNHSAYGKYHEGWSSLIAPDGTLLWMDNCRADTNSNTQRYIGIYASKDGNRWYDIGHINLAGTGVQIPRGMFSAGGKVWVSVDGMAGKSVYNTTAFSLAGKFREERADNLGPCYYVDFANGNDSNSGYSQALAWKTVRNMFATSGTITHGARVVLSAGTSVENGVATINYLSNARPAVDTARHVQVSGQGKDATKITVSGATEGWKDTSAVRTWDIEFASLTIEQADPAKSLLWDGSSISPSPAIWTARDARIGNTLVGAARAIYLRTCKFVGIRSEILQIQDTGKYCLYIDGTATADVSSCWIEGGRSLQQAGGFITAKQTEFTRYASVGLTMAASSTVAYKVQNCIFSDSDQNPLTNSSGTTVTSSDVFDNFYNNANGAGIPVSETFEIAGAVDRDATRTPYEWSPLLGACAPVGVSWDLNGNPFRLRPAVGAVEAYG